MDQPDVDGGVACTVVHATTQGSIDGPDRDLVFVANVPIGGAKLWLMPHAQICPAILTRMRSVRLSERHER